MKAARRLAALTAGPSLYVRSAFPVDWLTKHYPALLGENYQGREVAIDAAFREQGASGQVIAMILASLFESPTHLLAKLDEGRERPPRRWSWAPQSITNTPIQSQEAFVRAYIQANGQAGHIAALLSCHIEVVYRRLQRYGLRKCWSWPLERTDTASQSLNCPT